MEGKTDAKAQHYYGRQLARAYVPFQTYTERYTPLEGLDRGTIFPELYFPYKEAAWKGEY
ncbi:hypothetical protein H0A61_02089 [Koleobacter methoxysyntrophicus]|jgi:hypothetical protein|uniref:Spore coat associated protein JA (CotJA) n=1 Tax=Koleobacter methoxysyntrophicus TaxID=2751313 RepID=A0A8A0RQ54_9FIRM|nr:spore coat associated protein CotJA [Koleobacter methoxysyntrophicus]MDI3540960.1 hypothetical protein [Thermosediminibacterales bacterium]MDK2902022.1 hypothetical protein [Thermosediminibacterales bacterium]NPV44525.1 spore coat associated protein CotJA [Bacillota bacterium]QSQ09710.1 hypothetical protein H0A61_02089 [Koleobacter methoxysyntrophicus]